MAEKSPIVQVRIGHYILGDTLGVGTFGKVKGIYIIAMPYNNNNYIIYNFY